jgi:sugar phosphate isomerase/epimerase
MFEPKFGASLIYICPDLAKESLAAVAKSRIETLEVALSLFKNDADGAKLAALQAMLASSNVQAASVHSLFGAAYDLSATDETARNVAVAAAMKAIDLAGAIDAKVIIFHASSEPISPADRPGRIEQAYRSFVAIGEYCRKAGCRPAIERLPRSCLGNTIAELTQLVDRLGAPFGVCLDTNHGMADHAALACEVKLLGDRLIATHLSDYDGIDEKHWLPGCGVVDWAGFMAALREIDYQGPFNYECKLAEQTPSRRLAGLEKNFDWLSQL